ncbi:MAG: hypothetical protein HYY06_21025 [Deltaproteobacteria bacterium]|nr:hypothetical protein [Deltaproteobacteria bacterium]
MSRLSPCVALALFTCSSPPAAWREPLRVPEHIEVRLDVPPNAPGEGEDLALGSFRLELGEPRLAVLGDEVVLVTGSEAGPQIFRLQGGELTPITPDSDDARRALAQIAVRDPERAGQSRIAVSTGGRAIVTSWPADGARPAKLSIQVEGARSGAAVPDLVAESSCPPVLLAVAADPIRVVWLDCAGDQSERRSTLRLSKLVDLAWVHSDAPEALVAPGATVDSLFTGARVLAAVLEAGGRGAILAHDGDEWASLAELPAIRVGRAGPPLLATDGARVLAAWHEPRARGSRILVREATRGRWPLLGRDGVDTSQGHAGARPAVGYTDGHRILVGVEAGGLSAMRWDGEEWRRIGGRVAAGGGASIAEVALGGSRGALVLVWSAGGRVWLARRANRGWQVEDAPLAEHAAAMAFASTPRALALAWLDDAGHAFVRQGEPGAGLGRSASVPGSFVALDAALTESGTLVALVPADGTPRVALARGAVVEDLGGPSGSRAAPAVAVAPTPSGEPLIAWPSPEGVSLARRSADGWSSVDCPAARGLGRGVDAVDLAIVASPRPAAWVAARQTAASSRVRAVMCSLRE